jgi:hypothetical protein
MASAWQILMWPSTRMSDDRALSLNAVEPLEAEAYVG